jgi:hypothetical protein
VGLQGALLLAGWGSGSEAVFEPFDAEVGDVLWPGLDDVDGHGLEQWVDLAPEELFDFYFVFFH